MRFQLRVAKIDFLPLALNTKKATVCIFCILFCQHVGKVEKIVVIYAYICKKILYLYQNLSLRVSKPKPLRKRNETVALK